MTDCVSSAAEWKAMAPAIVLQILGWAAFAVGALLTGRQFRRRSDRETAERTSRAPAAHHANHYRNRILLAL